jgi:hypothetical protein
LGAAVARRASRPAPLNWLTVAAPPRAFSPDPLSWWSADTVEPERLRWQLGRLVRGGVFSVVLDGELWLELSDGAEVKLAAGDVVVTARVTPGATSQTGRPRSPRS